MMKNEVRLSTTEYEKLLGLEKGFALARIKSGKAEAVKKGNKYEIIAHVISGKDWEEYQKAIECLRNLRTNKQHFDKSLKALEELCEKLE